MPSWVTTTGLIAAYILLYLVMLVGVAIIPFGVPGQFIIVGAGVAFVLIAGPQVISWWTVLGVLGLAVLAEVMEATAGFFGASQAEGSFWSSVGAVIGGLAGAIIGSMILPLVGSLLGAFVGTFLGAFAVEYSRTQAFAKSGQVAKGALIGRIIASVLKVFMATVMIAVITAALFG